MKVWYCSVLQPYDLSNKGKKHKDLYLLAQDQEVPNFLVERLTLTKAFKSILYAYQ